MSETQSSGRPEVGEPAPGAEGPLESAEGVAAERSSTGLEPNVAGLLCYALGIVTGIIFLIAEKRSRFVRFHAVQSTVTFGSILLLQAFGGFIPIVGGIVLAVLTPIAFVLWILLMYRAYQGDLFRLPIAGDIAEEHSAVRGY